MIWCVCPRRRAALRGAHWKAPGRGSRAASLWAMVVLTAASSGCNEQSPTGTSRGPAAASRPARTSGSADEWAWFDAQTSTWRAMEYARIDDQESAIRLTTEWAAHRIPGPRIDDVRFGDDLGVFLHAWSCKTSDDYLSVRDGSVRAPADLRDVPVAARIYERRLGRPAANPEQVLQALWTLDAEIGRPAAFARIARIMVATTAPLSRLKPNEVKDALLAVRPPTSAFDGLEPNELLKWIGYSAAGSPRATVDRIPAASVLREHDTALIAQVGCVVQTTTGLHFPVELLLYQDPAANEWFVHSASTSYPQPVCWPI